MLFLPGIRGRNNKGICLGLVITQHVEQQNDNHNPNNDYQLPKSWYLFPVMLGAFQALCTFHKNL